MPALPVTIRAASEEDAPELVAIYAPAVTESATSFESELPTAGEMARRVRETLACLPWLVCELEGRLAGYAYAARHRTREAYQWSVEVSAYVRSGARRSGVGRALYAPLLAILAQQGFQNALAGIALPNPASVAFHEALGFQPVGIYRGVGYKLGSWRDVGWWQLELKAREDSPREPRPFAELDSSPESARALAAAAKLVRRRP